MPKNWKTHTLGEVVDLKQGLAINKGTDHLLCEDGENSIPLFKIRDLLNDTVEHYVKANEVPKQCVAIETDLIYTRTGQVGYVFRGKNGCIHNNCFKVIPDNRLHRDFLYHFLANPAIRKYANEIASGSVQKDLNHGAFKSIGISFPGSIVEQRAIASILSALDDKIENNLAMNKTLEDMAMALYKHWFVDFGPFADGEFVDSELGMIPKGWELKRLEELITLISKGTTPRIKDTDNLNSEIPFLKVKDIKEDGSIKYQSIEKIPLSIHKKQLKRSILQTNDILFSIAGTIGRVSFVPKILNGSNCNQALAFIRLKEKKKFFSHVYLWLKSKNTQQEISSSIVQGVQANVSLTVLKDLKLALPNTILIEEFRESVNPLLDLVAKNRSEIQTLTQIRDTLLPKLISGEVRLKEFKETLANVL